MQGAKRFITALPCPEERLFSATLDKISLVTREKELETLIRSLYTSFIAYYINIPYMFKFTT